ncbi:bacitracin ABC transporter ATP-binding protein [Bacillus mycoides]|nr:MULTISPECIES: ABC transporter ATP-binding protein [Bacillus cereus group]MBJ8009620.1 ABC transporter ATP-binding protein [Bacillus cereus]MBJ8073179.1 ABC transporter ATP-binding protein [Bacillus cereus]MBJ8190275.1 ABC transporter ATP-binding protein [Bacillus cereus]MDM5460233.1 ABC transporter ATP-binding protein [Bacillus cereus]OFD51794.1 bacitracin ABC transporter ATP-binding protein [Bacillus mycoides]
MGTYIVETEDLTKTYGAVNSVNQLQMQVGKGEIYGFLGPNGAGKTTTIRMLLGLIKPTTGNIKVFNRDLKTNRIDILREVGSLVESPSYYGHLTGHENLEVIRQMLQVPKKNIDEVLRIVRLEKQKDKLVKQYSLGMKQRLGIAMALLGNPKLLILDEPTNGLDPAGIQEIRELIKQLPKQYDMTVVISSHLLNEMDQIATQVGIINSGQLIFQDKIEVLRKKSQASMKIRVNDVVKAHQILEQHQIHLGLEGDCLVTYQQEDHLISHINHLLVQQNISVYRIEEEKHTLEEIFLSLTEKGGVL